MPVRKQRGISVCLYNTRIAFILRPGKGLFPCEAWRIEVHKMKTRNTGKSSPSKSAKDSGGSNAEKLLKQPQQAKHIRENDPYSPCVRLVRSGNNPLDGITTMDELFRMSVMRHGTKKCVGVREVLAEADEYYKNGKVFKKVRLGDYQWFSYIDIEQRVENLTKGMLEIGLQPKKQVVIFAETRVEWMLVCQVCFRINVPVATLYATLGEDGIIHGINETEVTHIFTSQELLGKLKKILGKTPAITHVVYMENVRPVDTSGFSEKVSVISFSQLEKMGATCDPISKPDPPTPNDLAVIMYTSGSTGIPKGVMLTHKNMVTTATGLLDCIPVLEPDDMYIGYLPLAHAFEIAAECFFFVMGVPFGYSSPHTMTDKSTAIMPGCKGDASLLKPTILTAVPLMLDRIRKGVTEVTNSKGPFAKEFFKFAMQYKKFWYKKGFNTPILNRLVFKKIKDMVGGNVRIIACGGAPLSPDTHDFIRLCLDVKMIQAYGMTETAASATIMSLADCSTGRVGAPLSNCYIKLVDWTEGNYHATDKPYPRGEIVIGGDCVALGYFKNDSLTKESFKEEDGVKWFYTGDIGEMYPDGTFKIIDRKKDLVKLQYGEYISLGKVEAELKTCPLVDNICVVGNGLHDYLVALVVPNIQQLRNLAVSLGKQELSIHELCQDPSVISIVSKAITEQGQKSKLMRTEIPTKVKLVSEEWQPETGLVTAAFKIRRKMIEQFYKNSIEEMYTAEPKSSSKST
ncbi:long-chain-fatty-acid--CoA ligase 4-like isoform X3 [Stegodyphus dumicola]|uniref:long-chain-fatty-acid--CoA ligase 4-like isoform X3 n=1 Tax=Stegodyphus dumicola TaxID=202533 RepID=UPI0015AE99A3|nr:long-chain-fatty-acid--CoA ligase 4-like isoform X3 [Stegodyphus dumicola]